MSLPNLGSFRCYSSSFIGKGCTRIKGRAILGRSLHNDAISRVGYANAFIAKSTSTSDDNQINRPDPLAFGHDGPFIKRALVRRQKKEDVSSGFSSSDKYRISGDIRPEQVLYVKALNGNLIPEDFVRTIGTGAPAYIRVIPLRNRQTYRKDGNYLIVFKSAEDVHAWRKHVERLSSLTNKHTMTSILQPDVKPGPGFLINKVPVYEVTKQFTLLPAGSRLRSNWSQRLSPFKDSLIQRGGYSLVCKKNGFIVPKVLIRIFGVRLTISDLLQALLSDSIRRNMAWEIVLKQPNGDSNITEMTSVDELENNRPKDEQAAYGEGSFGDGQGWVVEFKSQRAAHQFARTWHGIPFPFPSQKGYRWNLSYEAEAVMNAGTETKTHTEVLW